MFAKVEVKYFNEAAVRMSGVACNTIIVSANYGKVEAFLLPKSKLFNSTATVDIKIRMNYYVSCFCCQFSKCIKYR
jgi:hypothetical protein